MLSCSNALNNPQFISHPQPVGDGHIMRLVLCLADKAFPQQCDTCLSPVGVKSISAIR